MRCRILAVLCVVTAVGCNIDFRPLFGIKPDAPAAGKALLVRFESPEQLRSYIAEQSQKMFRDGGSFLEDTVGIGAPGAPGAPGADAANSAGDGAAPPGTDNPQFSTTTEQEEGVQEADVLKTDGSFIYVFDDNALRIVRADPGQFAEVSHVDLEGFGRDLYLVGDRVVAITSPDAFAARTAQVTDAIGLPPPQFFQPQTEVTVIDVSDRSAPRVLSRSRLDGSVNTSRMIDDRLYLVVLNFPNNYVPEFDQASLDDILPDIAVQVGEGQPVVQPLTPVTDHFRPVEEDGFGFTTVVSMDINDPAGYDAQTVVAQPANVYASTDALYLTDGEFKFDGTFRESTSIYKFDFTSNGVRLSAGGKVSGRVLNQYSMGEYQGFLRVATTDRRDSAFGSSTSNSVFVLEQNEDRLEQAGSIEGLAPGESIFSARFIADRGYLVTFRQIDPLFTLDLSDPRNPRTVGELKVPGFSTFIVPMDEDHILTIGRDTSDDFGFVRSEGVRLSIFDVTDFADPQLAHVEVIGTNGGDSEALFNPKAFTYFAEGDLVAFPMQIHDFGGPVFGPIDVIALEGDAGTGTTASGAPDEPVDSGTSGPAPVDGGLIAPEPIDEFVGLYVYRVTADAGFTFLGRISTQPTGPDTGFFFPSFTRGVFIDNAVYAVTSLGAQAALVDDVPNVIASVVFPTPVFEDPSPLPVEPPIVIVDPSTGGSDTGGSDMTPGSGGGAPPAEAQPAS